MLWAAGMAFVMGLMAYTAARFWANWPERYQPIFWVVVFAPMAMLEFAGVEHPVKTYMVFPLCAGLIVGEIMRPRVMRVWARVLAQAQGNPPPTARKKKKPPSE